MNKYGCKIDNLLSWQVVVNGVWGTAISICRYGGIGRHMRFKPAWRQLREGSTPSVGTRKENLSKHKGNSYAILLMGFKIYIRDLIKVVRINPLFQSQVCRSSFDFKLEPNMLSHSKRKMSISEILLSITALHSYLSKVN